MKMRIVLTGVGLFLSLLLLACGPTATPLPTLTPVPPTRTPAAVLPLTGEYHSAEGGFALLYPEGWETLDFGAEVLFYQEENSLNEGVPSTPVLLVSAGPLEQVFQRDLSGATTSEEMASLILEQVRTDASFAGTTSLLPGFDVAGREAGGVDFDGTVGGVPAAGRFVTVLLEGNRGLVFTGLAQKPAWETFLPTLEAMLDSVALFPPEVTALPTAVPVTPAPPPTPVPPPTPGPPPEGFAWQIKSDTRSDTTRIASPGGMDVGPDGLLYVADLAHGLMVLDPTSGRVLRRIGQDNLVGAVDVAIAADGTIYVSDWGSHAIYAFAPDGTLLTSWGGAGSGDGEFGRAGPGYIAVCPDGTLYVVDINERDDETYERIQVFDAAGTYLTQWDLSAMEPFPVPAGLACGADGSAYLSDFQGGAVVVLDAMGNRVAELGDEAIGDARLGPLALGPDGNLYVATWQGWIGVLDLEGNLLARWGTPGNGEGDMPPGQFYLPRGIAVDGEGNVYVSDATDTWVYITRFYFPELR